MTTTNTITAVEQLHGEVLKNSVESFWNIKPQRFIHIQRFITMFENLKNTFKIISVLAVVLLAMFFVQPNVALADNFSQSCDSAILYQQNPGMLYAHCRRFDGSWNEQARIQLNDLITNNDGRLAWQRNGNFLSSCEWNTGDWNVTSLNQNNQNFISFQTVCQNRQGNRTLSQIYLNEHINNDNGDLNYHD